MVGMPIDYFGEYDPRTYAAPIPYIDPENGQQKIAFQDASFNEYGYKKKHKNYISNRCRNR